MALLLESLAVAGRLAQQMVPQGLQVLDAPAAVAAAGRRPLRVVQVALEVYQEVAAAVVGPH